jgi:ribosomal-protein-alanine N-acetyltransferase
MREAFLKVVAFGFETLKLKTIEAHTHPDNESSIKLLVKNNFKKIKAANDSSENNEVLYALTMN